MTDSNSDAKVYVGFLLGALSFYAVKGAANLTRSLYEVATKTPNERINIRLRKVREYVDKARFDHAIEELSVAEKISRDHNVPLPQNFEYQRKSVYFGFLDSIVRVMPSLEILSLDRLVSAAETLAKRIGTEAHEQLQEVRRLAGQKHIEWAMKHAEQSEDRDSNLLPSARYHLDRARELHATSTDLVEILIREKENTAPFLYKDGF